MPTATSGIYVAVVEQSYFGDTLFNTFAFHNPTLGDDEQSLLATQMDTVIVPEMSNIQSQSLNYENIRVANLTGNLADVNITPAQGQGGVTGSVMASFVAAAYRYQRTTKETRNGSKRFGGMVEENVIGGSFTVAFNALLDTLAGILEGSLLSFDPIILRQPEVSSGTYLYNPVLSVQNLDRLTTQSSRKRFS